MTGPSPLSAIGEKAQFVASARYSDGSTKDQTSSAQWLSSDSLVIAVAQGGLATATGGGTATVRATVQGVTGARSVQVVPNAPVQDANTQGRIDNTQTAADLIAYHQDNTAWSAFRALGVITRWDLPVRVYAEPSVSRGNVERALSYWQTVAGLPYVLIDSNAEPRILVRAGSEGLFGTAQGRGGIDATYSNNRARSGFVEIRPDLASCDPSQTSCAVLFEQTLGGALGIFGQVPGGITFGATRASSREINLLVGLYSLPHGAHVGADGSWNVIR